MERHELENSREFKAAKELEHALNDYGWNGKRFAIAVTTTYYLRCESLMFQQE